MKTNNRMDRDRSTSSQIDGKLPPQAKEIEQIILGACLIESDAFEKIASELSEADFYDKRNQSVFKAISGLYKERKTIDMMTVTQAMLSSGDLESIGGPIYIASLTSKIGSSAHILDHAMIVKERSIQRKGLVIANELENAIYSNEDIGDVLHKAINGSESLMEELIGKSNGEHISKALKGSMDGLYKRVEMARKNIRSGVDTGLHDLNKITNGWQPGNLVIIAARPSMGKTAVMLHLAKSAARSNIPVAIFSLEMSDISLANRLILSECDVDPERFKSGYMTNEEINKVETAVNELWRLPIYVDDNPCVTMDYIRSRCKILKKQGKCGIIMADYLQLAESGEREGSREREVAKMSRTAKITAKELKVPFLLLSQLNRGNEARPDKKPLLSDLRESGAIEQDADIVMFIHRPEYYKIEVKDKNGNVERNYGELIVAKNRDGATGLVKFKHNDGMTKFYDYGSCDKDMPF